ncbi:MAG: UxaA family hydrolase [Pseudomonadota bacterium]
MTHLALRLDPQDDVAVVLAATPAGGSVQADDGAVVVTARATIPIHHKIALRDLAEGEALRRGGIVIGQTTASIIKGDHVHTHNLRSLRAQPNSRSMK